MKEFKKTLPKFSRNRIILVARLLYNSKCLSFHPTVCPVHQKRDFLVVIKDDFSMWRFLWYVCLYHILFFVRRSLCFAIRRNNLKEIFFWLPLFLFYFSEDSSFQYQVYTCLGLLAYRSGYKRHIYMYNNNNKISLYLLWFTMIFLISLTLNK